MAFHPGDRRFQAAHPAMVQAVDRVERLRQIAAHQAQAEALEQEACREQSEPRADALRRQAEVRRAWAAHLRQSVRGAADFRPTSSGDHTSQRGRPA